MRKSFLLIPFIFMFAVNATCPPAQTETAKDVLTKVSFYTNMAKTLVTDAETYYADNPKVKSALEATKASLATVDSLAKAISAGIEKDENKIILATADLIRNVFTLVDAIKEAKAAKTAAPASAPPK